VYLIPGAALLLVPILLGLFAVDEDTHPVGGTGGTYLMWFGIWLEIVWGSLWVSRMITSLMPPLFQALAKASGSTNAKKWRDIGQQLELHTALFLWFLAVLVSFKPTCDGHRVPIPEGDEEADGVQWIDIVFKIIIAFFVLAALNFVEKICIQWIAGAFHERTYATRIENNKGDIRQLVQLFEHAKAHLQHTDSFWQGSSKEATGGSQTPMRVLHDNAAHVFSKVGQVAGKVGNDLIGRKVENANHPRKIVSELLRTTSSAHTLARLIYRSVVREGQEMVFLEDMQAAFKTPEEAEAAFNVFDKDLNGDISMEEFEAVTNEIGMEKKAIAASLKDLDSVIKKLDKVFLFVIVIITIIIFISIISNSAAAGLASAGSAVLGLAWVLQATAQEFLQSIIFVFVKHPFDVGDRVTIYGSTGANMTGDDYYVTEISLLYTEFKKLEGHFVQAPNSLLNTLFILNQRRSNGLADPISLKIRFGTPAWMIDELKARMLKFCLENKRDYQGTILTELTGIEEQRAAKLNVIFIHKTNFQNEVIRMGRHSRFVLELMANMVDIGIQAPYRVEPGGSREHPMYWAGMQPPPYGEREQANDNLAPPRSPSRGLARQTSITSGSSQRFAPSASSNVEMTGFGDVFENRREVMIANRLASIKEKNLAVEKHEQVTKAENAEVTSSTSALAPERSHDSQARSRLFSRPRSKSTLPMHRPRGSSDFV
jgi:small-conductance mechanosensitive channel